MTISVNALESQIQRVRAAPCTGTAIRRHDGISVPSDVVIAVGYLTTIHVMSSCCAQAYERVE